MRGTEAGSCLKIHSDPFLACTFGHLSFIINNGLFFLQNNHLQTQPASRARIPQIMGLLNLPPWEQEQLLFLDSAPGRARVPEREIRERMAKNGLASTEI